MILVENVREVHASANGSHSAKLDIQVSTAADLPELNGNVGGFKILPGSIAQCIQSGKWYTLDGNGTWYDEDGRAAGG